MNTHTNKNPDAFGMGMFSLFCVISFSLKIAAESGSQTWLTSLVTTTMQDSRFKI